MSHFAKLDSNNIVTFVTVGRQEDNGKEQELSQRTGDVYKQTSYNTHCGVHYDPNTNKPSSNQSRALEKIMLVLVTHMTRLEMHLFHQNHIVIGY